MASWVEELPSGSFRVSVRTSDGVRRKTFKRGAKRGSSYEGRARAREWGAAAERALREGTFVDERKGDMPLRTWWPIFTELRAGLRETTKARTEDVWRLHIEPVWGDVPLRRVAELDVVRWVNVLTNETDYAPSHVAKIVRTFGAALNAAVRHGMIVKNPAAGIKLDTTAVKKMHVLEPSEIWALAGVIDERYRATILVGCYAGLRLGELCGLHQADIDRAVMSLTVRRSTVEVQGRIIEGKPKTRAGVRTIPLPRAVVAALPPCDGRTLAFPSPHGDTLRAGLFRQRFFAPAVKKAGLAPFTPHDMRHTAVSLWIAAGVDAGEVAKRAGHRSVSTVYDIYGHLFDSSDDRFRDRLEAFAIPDDLSLRRAARSL